MEELLKHFQSFLLDLPTDNSGLLTGRKLSKVSVKNYLSDTRRFLNWISSTSTNLDKSRAFADPRSFLNANVFHSYYQHLRGSSTPLATTNRHLSSLRRFGTFIAIHFNTTNPAQNLPNLALTPTPSSLLEDYRRHLKAKSLASATIKNYLSDTDQFLQWIAVKNLNLKELTSIQLTQLLHSYQVHLSATDKSTTTVNRHLISLKKFFNFISPTKMASNVAQTDMSSAPTRSSNGPFYFLATLTALLLFSFTSWATFNHLQRQKPSSPSTSNKPILGLLATPPTFPPISFGHLLGASTTRTDNAQFGEINTKKLSITSSGLISPQSTTIGSAVIPANQTSVIINNRNVLATTQIYLTPTSETGNSVIFVKQLTPGVSFTIGTQQPSNKPLTFNYWLIQTQ